MKRITVKLSESMLRRLRNEARATGRSAAAVIREQVEIPPDEAADSVHDRAGDLSGILAGRRRAATNKRRRFTRP